MNKEDKKRSNKDKNQQYVGFALGEEVYAIDVMLVESIERVTEITPVPKTQYYVLGIINIRGDIVPVIDLRRRLGMEEIQHSEDIRIIITRFSGYRVGILVDAAYDLYTVDCNSIQTGEDLFREEKGELISGVMEHKDQYVLILDLPKVLELDEQRG